MVAENDMLQIIHIRYYDGKFVQQKRLPVDEYQDSGIYQAMEMPFNIDEPRVPESCITKDEVRNIGTLNGLIAEIVGTARKGFKPILMTGGMLPCYWYYWWSAACSWSPGTDWSSLV